MAYIYVIRNKINDKVYIGQTRRTIEERFRDHLDIARNKKVQTKVYVKMREIGIDNFYPELLIECDENELNKYEQYYVEKYDSLNNGYNSVYPCSSIGKRPVHDYEDKIVDLYTSGHSYSFIAMECNISLAEVGRVVNENNLDTTNREYTRESKSRSVGIIMYNAEFNNGTYFDSIKDAYNTVSRERNRDNFTLEFYSRVKVACQNGNVAYSHRWQLASDLAYDDKIFRTKFDKEAYIQGKPAYQPEGKQYYIVDGAITEVLKHYYSGVKHTNRCIDCNTEISSKANRCKKCSNIHINHSGVFNYDSKCPDKSTLEQLLNEYNFSQIGRKYGVSGNAVKKWAKKYGLYIPKNKNKPSKEELGDILKHKTAKEVAEMYCVTRDTVYDWAHSYDIKIKDSFKILCLEDDIYFDTFRDAAKYMMDNKLTNETNLNHVSYHISKVVNSNSNYRGKHWIKILSQN